MADKNQTSLTIVSIAGAIDAQVDLLLNLYETPIDPDAVYSAVHAVTLTPSGFDGRPRLDVNEWLTCISSTDNGSIFGCSMDGNVHVFDGKQWSVVATEADLGLNHIFALDDRVAYTVGLRGEILKVAGGMATASHSPTGVRLNGIDGCSAECIYAVGDDGQILQFDGVVWNALPPMTNANLLCVLCVAPDRVYVGGAAGVAFHWDGVNWHDIDAAQVTISSFADYQGQIYAAGGKDGVLVLKSGSLQPFKSLALHKLEVAHDLLFGAGGSFFVWFNGTEWRGGEYVPRW